MRVIADAVRARLECDPEHICWWEWFTLLKGTARNHRWPAPGPAASGEEAGKEGSVEDAEVVLRRAPLFEGLDEESARALRRQMPDVKLSRGEHLFLEGQDGDRLYVVLDGKMKLTRAAVDGRENLISVIGPGEMFGELSLFDPRPRTSTASAVTDATLAALAHDTLRPWLLERPDVSMHMLRALARRLRRANDVTADLVFTDVPGRVAKNLLDLADRFGQQERDGLHVHHDLTQEELAQLVGASRETVNKALADFAARGWLQISARSVLILDSERLRRRAR
jgi:CRP/FNR family transcriptional regulator, cyclic AMP receptor protein